MAGASIPNEISVADVLRGVDASVFMRDAAWLDEAIASGRAPLIIDLRAESAFVAGHIPGSVAVSLRHLPDRFDTRTPREREVVCVCGGSIQSAMAVVYLRTLGYPHVFNLSGGISAWERTGHPLDLSGHAWRCEPRSTRTSSMSTPEHRDHHGNPEDLKAYIARLDDPGRDEWQRPDVVLATLGIAKESVVCEIGTGTGYFALRLAKQAAWVYAIDVEPQLLSLLRERAASAGVQNLTPVLGLPLDPLIPPASCDLILTVNTLHHVPEKAAYLRRLKEALRPGGRVAIVDFHKRELPVGPPVDHKLAREECLEQIRAAELRVLAEHDVLPHQYFLITAA